MLGSTVSILEIIHIGGSRGGAGGLHPLLEILSLSFVELTKTGK